MQKFPPSHFFPLAAQSLTARPLPRARPALREAAESASQGTWRSKGACPPETTARRACSIRALGSIKKAKVNGNSHGPNKTATDRRLAIAPCSAPCSRSLTRCVIIPCAAGPEMVQSIMIGIEAMNTVSGPSQAGHEHPNAAKKLADVKRATFTETTNNDRNQSARNRDREQRQQWRAKDQPFPNSRRIEK